jgi:hypothetical protein
MKKLIVLCFILVITACSNNYSNGERVGLVTQFSKTGLIWDSWEGQLNMTQTGMNSSAEFDFSLDNDMPELQDKFIPILDSAAHYGWKVSLSYTEVTGYNWLNNRGCTNHFIKNVVVLDKNPMHNVFNKDTLNKSDTIYVGHRDTIYVVIKK